MKAWLIEFLKALEEAIPPALHCHHAITYSQYGSDESGWQDRLCLQVGVSGAFHQFFLDDEDFEHPIPGLVSKISDSIANPTPSAQLSNTPLRYLPEEVQL